MGVNLTYKLQEEAGGIAAIEEKPSKPKSDYCVIGIYMYGSDVFDTIRSIEVSDRGGAGDNRCE